MCVYIYITQINILKFYTNFYYERYVFYSCKVFYICLFEEPSLRRSEKGRNISDSEWIMCESVRFGIYAFFFCLFVYFWRDSPQLAMASSFTRFLDHIQWRTTVGRTPLDAWSARRRDLYLITHNDHNRQTSMHPEGFEPTTLAGERPQTYALDRAANGTGMLCWWYLLTNTVLRPLHDAVVYKLRNQWEMTSDCCLQPSSKEITFVYSSSEMNQQNTCQNYYSSSAGEDIRHLPRNEKVHCHRQEGARL